MKFVVKVKLAFLQNAKCKTNTAKKRSKNTQAKETSIHEWHIIARGRVVDDSLR